MTWYARTNLNLCSWWPCHVLSDMVILRLNDTIITYFVMVRRMRDNLLSQGCMFGRKAVELLHRVHPGVPALFPLVIRSVYFGGCWSKATIQLLTSNSFHFIFYYLSLTFFYCLIWISLHLKIWSINHDFSSLKSII